MLLSSLTSPALWSPFINLPIFRESLDWIKMNAETAAPGKHELGKPGWFVAVDGYSTKPADECHWENHTKTIDIQYLMEGTEGILVLPSEKLGEPTLYKEASDTQKFAPTDIEATLVVLRQSEFVVFLPGEAHCPKVAVGTPVHLRKLVVKIPIALLAPSA